MPEHVHKWKWVYGLGDGIAAACECGVHLAPEEVNRRLNATERLSAEDAKAASEFAGRSFGLVAYASALEGNDA